MIGDFPDGMDVFSFERKSFRKGKAGSTGPFVVRELQS